MHAQKIRGNGNYQTVTSGTIYAAHSVFIPFHRSSEFDDSVAGWLGGTTPIIK